MSEIIDTEMNTHIRTEACAWVAQLESGDLSSSDIAALREWMGRSPRHADEIKAVGALSGQLSVLTEMLEPLEQAVSADNRLRIPRWRFLLGSPMSAMAGAVCVCFVFAIAVFFLQTSPAPTKIYRTAIGEIETIVLADGSSVKLNTDSQIEVDFSGIERRVRLINGEVFFDVAHNPERPFRVYSGETVSQAIGTSFVVKLREAITELAVVQGKVAFSKIPEAMTNAKPQKVEQLVEVKTEDPVVKLFVVSAGQVVSSEKISEIVSAGQEAHLPTIESRDIQRKLSWTEGLFDFSETPLEEVVFEISRHNQVTIEIIDAELREMKFGGMFRTGDLDGLLEALERLDIVVERRGDGHILLRKTDRM